MSLERWPNWLRWILFIPAAVVAMVMAHLAVSIAFSGNENEASVFGIGVEGSGAQWINAIKFNLVARFFEPWAFVAAGGVVGPGFPYRRLCLPC